MLSSVPGKQFFTLRRATFDSNFSNGALRDGPRGVPAIVMTGFTKSVGSA